MWVHDSLIRKIAEQKKKEEQCDKWEKSPYKDLVKLQSNNVGNVGEGLIEAICKATNIPSSCDGSKTKKKGGGDGDGKILGHIVEIKTAHEGCGESTSYQHELGEVPWKPAFYIFVDISPHCIYITIFKNVDESTYKESKKYPCFPTRSITWRKEKGAFKFDTTVKINEKSVEEGHAVKIIPTMPRQKELVAELIRKVFPKETDCKQSTS